MKLAIIADIHGNLHALEAVLRDIERLKVDSLIVNGDLVNRGPNNVAVMERLRATDATIVLGNHDDLMRKWIEHDPDIPDSWYEDPFWKSTAWCAHQLQEAGWMPALRGLPMTHALALPGAPRLLISHGSPRHLREGYGRFLPDQVLSEIVEQFPYDVLVGSHTHRPMVRRWGRTLMLNTGAVGAPFNEDWRAQYLLLTLQEGEWAWEFRAVDYDREAALALFETMGYLANGDLSARIFWEELRHSRPLYAPYWSWAEAEGRPRDWDSWKVFQAQFAKRFVSPTAVLSGPPHWDG